MSIVIRNGQPTIITREAYSGNCCCSCPILPKDWGTFPCAGKLQSYQVSWDSPNGEGIGEVGASWYYSKWVGGATITAVLDQPCWWEGVGGEYYFVPRDENGDGEPVYFGPGWFRLRQVGYAVTPQGNIDRETCSAFLTVGYIELGIRTNSVLSLEQKWNRKLGSPYPPGKYIRREIFADQPVTPIIIS
jgi:hypothetical protein